MSAASIDQRQQSNESHRKQIENPTENKSQQRSAYLKSEVKQFLQDKQLLRQLEQSQNTRAVELLRTQILAKSGEVQKMIEELKQIKQSMH